MTRCVHGELLAVCRECSDPLDVTPRDTASSSVGCVLLLLAVAFGVVAGYLLGVTR